MEKQQVVVIHGGDTFATYEAYLEDLKGMTLDLSRVQGKGWKDGLENDLGEEFEIIRPRMPNASNAKYLEWKIWFQKYLPYLKENTILVGHSLGGIFLAKYIAEEGLPKKARALILVAAPYDALDAGYSLADFVLPPSLETIHAHVSQVVLMHSEDDTIVPFGDMRKYKKALPEAEEMVFTNHGHFIGEHFPELLKKITLLRRSGEGE